MNHPNDPKGAVGATKCPLHLLPPDALRETAWVHKLGAEKYGPFNWRTHHVNATTYVAAIMRHLMAWSEGEDLDPESGRSHLAHIAASANILMDAQATETLVDDRYKRAILKQKDPEISFNNGWCKHAGGKKSPCDMEAQVQVLYAGNEAHPVLLHSQAVCWEDVRFWRYADAP